MFADDSGKTSKERTTRHRYVKVLAMVVTIALLAAACTSSSDGGGRAETSDEPLALKSSLFMSFATDDVSGIVGNVAGSLFSFALSGIGGTGGDQQALNNISNELKEIESELSTMTAQLSALIKQVDIQTCEDDWNSVKGTVGDIQDWWGQYQGFVTDYGPDGSKAKGVSSSDWPPAQFASFSDELYGSNGQDSSSAVKTMTTCKTALWPEVEQQGSLPIASPPSRHRKTFHNPAPTATPTIGVNRR